jgi:zinc D-Ala-D-Ala dipeptidase
MLKRFTRRSRKILLIDRMRVSRVALLLSAPLLGAALSARAELPEGFVYVEDTVPGVILDIRYATPDNFVGKRIDGYNAPRAILTLQAAQALQKVQFDLLRFGFALKVFDAYRPQRAVRQFVRWARDRGDTLTKRRHYPNIPKEKLFIRQYIAGKSSHSRGSTVDVTIVLEGSRKQRELDMGTRFDFFDSLAWPESDAPTAEQRANRALLRFVMEKHGFEAHEQEWWHFTLTKEPFPDTYFDFPVE